MKRMILTLAKTLKKILIALAAMAVLHFVVSQGSAADFVGSNFLVTGFVYAVMAWSQFLKNDGEVSFSMMGQVGGLRHSGDEMAARSSLYSTVKGYGADTTICWISSLLAALFFLLIGMAATM